MANRTTHRAWKGLAGLVMVALLWGASGCNGYNEVLKSNDPEYQLERAIGFIDSSQCYGALMVLEDLMNLTRGTSQGREVQYHHARAQYCLGDYYLARYYYKQFARTYPDDPRSEQAQFDAAMCSYRLSPSPSLDQTETRTAIEELQLFMDSYPGSPMRDSCQSLIDNLRHKLERKSYETATLYHKTQQYKSATIALRQPLPIRGTKHGTTKIRAIQRSY
jgi:outer membrane protein assembly factor BamD